MKWLWDILLGVDPAAWADDASWSIDWLGVTSGDVILWLLVGGAAVAWGAFFLYKREGRGMSLSARLMLTTLRVGTLALVAAMLLEPVLVLTVREYAPSHLLILVDHSASMGLRDAHTDANADARARAVGLPGGVDELRRRDRLAIAEQALSPELLTALAADGDRIVHMHEFAEQFMPADSASRVFDAPRDEPTDATGSVIYPPSDATGSATAIGAAVRQALVAYRGKPLAGVLLVSDGQSNSGPLPLKAAEFAAAEGVPVNVLAAGTLQGPRNARLARVEASPVVFVRDTMELHAVIESRGMSGAPGTLVLEKSRNGGEWEELARDLITLGETGERQTVTFKHIEESPGTLDFRARLVDTEAEPDTTDNTAAATVKVIRQQIHTLLIAGSSFPEIQFLRNSLYQDSRISLSSWLQSAQDGYDHLGNESIRRLPVTQEELNHYDCVVLYDPDPSRWPASFPDMLHTFVAEAGGGLVYIAGEQFTPALFDQPIGANRLLDLLPVLRDPGLFATTVDVRLSSRNAWRLAMTDAGKRDPVLHFVDNPDDNARIFDNLPGMYWHFPVTRAKPGATVLAVHGDPRMRNQHGPHVLLATQLYGPGRTIFIGFDSTYRWRYLDEQYFDGFWARVADRAGRNKQLGGRYPFTLTTDRNNYTPGSQVTLTARFVSATDVDAGIDQLFGRVERAGDEPQDITLSPDPDDAASYRATFTASKAGSHRVRVWAGSPGQPPETGTATMQFDVAAPDIERERPVQDRASLQALASATGGQVFDYEDLASLPDAFHVRQVARELEDREEIWDAPLLFGLVLLLLFTEWVLRKKYRLV